MSCPNTFYCTKCEVIIMASTIDKLLSEHIKKITENFDTKIDKIRSDLYSLSNKMAKRMDDADERTNDLKIQTSAPQDKVACQDRSSSIIIKNIPLVNEKQDYILMFMFEAISAEVPVLFPLIYRIKYDNTQATNENNTKNRLRLKKRHQAPLMLLIKKKMLLY